MEEEPLSLTMLNAIILDSGTSQQCLQEPLMAVIIGVKTETAL